MTKIYELKERFKEDGSPEIEGVKSSFACTCDAETKTAYENEVVRLWNELQETQYKTFAEWQKATDYSVIQSLLYYLDFEHECTVKAMYHDMWCVLSAECYKNNKVVKYNIQYDELLFGLVDLINFVKLIEVRE